MTFFSEEGLAVDYCSSEDTLNNKPWCHYDIIIFLKTAFFRLKKRFFSLKNMDKYTLIHKILNIILTKQFGIFFVKLSNYWRVEEFLLSIWRHFTRNVVSFPSNFPLLASTSLFYFLCFNQTKETKISLRPPSDVF